MDKNKAELVYILDMSGSMGPLAEDTIGGYNTMIKQQKKLGEDNPEMSANVTTILFDDRYIHLYEGEDVKCVPELTDKEYSPWGMTAMLDAIGRTLIATKQKIDRLPDEQKPGTVTVTIMTDGHENASREFNWSQVQGMIKTLKEKNGWLFVFVGANIDVEKISADLGINANMARKFTASKAGLKSVFASVGSGTVKMRGAVARNEAVSQSACEDMMSEALDSIE